MTTKSFSKNTARWTAPKKDWPAQANGKPSKKCCQTLLENGFWTSDVALAGIANMPFHMARNARSEWTCRKNVLAEARKNHSGSKIEYIRMPIEEIAFPADSFDVVISSLAFHYVKSFEEIVQKVHTSLKYGGDFVFSCEHPVFTAYGTQDWYYDKDGNILHFPVDNYFMEGARNAHFLGEEVVKYHKTLTTYVSTLLTNGFTLTGLAEPQPASHLLHTVPGMEDELRRPMMLIVSARKYETL